MTNADQKQQTPDFHDSQEFDLNRMLLILWRHKLILIAAVVLFGVFFVINYAFPARKQASVRFRLEFKGAEKGEYPNGLRFSSADLLNTPVLRQIHDGNNLDKYMSFSQFKEALYVQRIDNPQTIAKMADLHDRLSARNITPVEREQIQQALNDVARGVSSIEYNLNFAVPNNLPSSLAEKTLNDILAGWASDANERLNVLLYRVPVYSENIIDRDFIDNEDYVIILDVLKLKCEQIIKNAETIMELPGGRLARTAETNVSIPEIIMRIKDIVDYRIEPLVGMWKSSGASKNREMTKIFVENRLFNLKLMTDSLDARSNVYTESLKNYSAALHDKGDTPARRTTEAGDSILSQHMPPLIPQLGESFIDMIVTLAGRNLDIEYRQKLVDEHIKAKLELINIDRQKIYYQQIIKDLDAAKKEKGAECGEIEKMLNANLNEIIAAMTRSIAELNKVYQRISEANLNPQRGLYSITASPRQITEKRFDLKQSLTIGVVFLLLVMFSVVTGNFIHETVKNKKA